MADLPVCTDLLYTERMQPVHPSAGLCAAVCDRRHLPYLCHNPAEYPLPNGIQMEYLWLCILHHLRRCTFNRLPVSDCKSVEVYPSAPSEFLPMAQHAGLFPAACTGCHSCLYYRFFRPGIPCSNAGHLGQRDLFHRLPRSYVKDVYKRQVHTQNRSGFHVVSPTFIQTFCRNGYSKSILLYSSLRKISTLCTVKLFFW